VFYASICIFWRIDTFLNLYYKFFMFKRIIAFVFLFTIILSACSPKTDNPVVNGFGTAGMQETEFPTPTPTPLPEVRISNADDLLIIGDYDSAYREYQLGSTQTTDPELVASSLLGMGRALLLKKDYYGAVNQFSSLLMTYPDGDARNTAFFFIAKAYDALDQFRLAADAYASFLAAMPGPLDSEINEMRGDSLMKYGDYAGAMSAFETALSTASGSRHDQLQIKIAQAATATGDNDKAINIYLSLNETSQSGYTKSQANLLLGRIYLEIGLPEQAYARFQDSVNNYPEAYDSYSALAALVDANQPVDQLKRGIIDYNVGQYGIAIQALGEYMDANPNHSAEANKYKALSFFGLGQYEDEIAEWDKVISNNSVENDYVFEAFDEKSYTQWLSLNDFLQAAQTCLTYAASYPSATENAAYMLDKAARIYVDGGYLSMAVDIYERLFNEYPVSDKAYPGLFKEGILNYRLGEYEKAQLTFQRLIVLTDQPEEQAAANLWAAKSLHMQGKSEEAISYFQKSANADPTGYYGIRAVQILNGEDPLPTLQNIDLTVDYESEKAKADRWMHDTFSIDSSVDLNSPGELANNIDWQRADEFNRLGMREEASNEYEILRNNLIGDAANTYRLMNHLLKTGYYRTAILASRQVLDLAGLSQAATLTDPPIYFNHIRFGTYFKDTVIQTSLEHNLDPMMIFSLIRQESLFDSAIVSVAAAQGLMQITPDTAVGIVENYGWPPNFTNSDLNRPYVNIRLGIHYYKRCLDLYKGNGYAALAAYNAGDTAAMRWYELSNGDPDLMLEIISYSETTNYIKSIVENLAIYKNLYSR